MIKLYTKNDCADCDQVKTLFKEQNVVHEHFNVDEDDTAYEFITRREHSLPVIYINGVEFPGNLLKMPRGLANTILNDLMTMSNENS